MLFLQKHILFCCIETKCYPPPLRSHDDVSWSISKCHQCIFICQIQSIGVPLAKQFVWFIFPSVIRVLLKLGWPSRNFAQAYKFAEKGFSHATLSGFFHLLLCHKMKEDCLYGRSKKTRVDYVNINFWCFWKVLKLTFRMKKEFDNRVHVPIHFKSHNNRQTWAIYYLFLRQRRHYRIFGSALVGVAAMNISHEM